VAPVLTSGTLSLVDSIVVAAVTNAITSASSSIITLANCQMLTLALSNVAPVVLNGFYSIFNCVYDKPNSTLVALSPSGGSTSSIDYFQYINADRLILASSGQITFPDGSTQTTAFLNNLSSYATNTLLQSTSGLLTPLTTTNTLTGLLVKTTDLNTLSATLLTRTDYSTSSATFLSTTIYQSASSSFATNTLLQSTSALLTPLTTTNTLTGLLVKTTDLNTLSTTLLTRTDANTLTSQLVTNTTFNSYQTNVANTTALLTPLTTTNTLTGLLVKTTDLNTLSATLLTRTDYSTSSATFLSTTIYQSASSSFATNTLLQSTSALLTPLTTTNTLTGLLVTNTTLNNLSGNWQTAYQNVSANNLYLNANTTSLSALNASLVVQTISAATYFGIPSTGGNSNQWNSAYTWVNTNSAAATFVTSISAPALSGTFYGDGSRLTGISATGFIFPNNLTVTSSISAPALSGTFYGDGSKLTGIVTNKLNNGTTQVILCSNNTLSVPNNLYVNSNVGVGTTTPIRKYHQEGGKFLVNSNDGSYGQFQFINPSNGEASLVIATNSYPNANGTISSNSDDTHMWGLGLGMYGNDSNIFTIGNANSLEILRLTDGFGATIYGNIYALGSITADETISGTNIKTVEGITFGDGSTQTTAFTGIPITTNFITAVSGTTNQINASRSGSTVTLSLPNSAIFPGDVNIQGNLTISGSATYINANNLIVNDNIIYFAAANPANTLDIGIVGHFTNAGNYNHTGLVRKAGNNIPGTWTLFSGLTTEPLSASNIDWTDPNIRIDSLSANLIGNVTGNASTVTNGVYTNGSYSDPSWITSLADSKITGTKFATNTTTNTLTSQLLLTTIYQNASGNWQTAYQSVSSQPRTLIDATSSIKPIRGNNTASGIYSNIAGGVCNLVSGSYSTIVGGFSGCATGYATFVGAGSGNCATCDYAVVVGGSLNRALSAHNFIGGGNNNLVTLGACSVVVGGLNNCTTNVFNFVGGGTVNCATAGMATVVGGKGNTATNNCSFIGGGCGNTNGGVYGVIVGGNGGTIGGTNNQGFIGNGCNNLICNTAYCSSIINGDTNKTPSGAYAFIGGGTTNTASGLYSSIVNGKSNISSGTYSFIAGGSANDTKGFTNTFILGTGLSALSANYTYFNNVEISNTPSNLIMKDTTGKRWTITVSTGGALVVTAS